MAGESQALPDSPPDPSVATNDAVARAVKAERDFVVGQFGILMERLNAIDRATELLNDTVTRTPTDIQKEVAHLRELLDEKLLSVAKQFAERDTRTERESRDNSTAVLAAFAAQEKQSLAQNTSNAEARDKSEKATADLLAALGEKVDDVKDRVGRVESVRVGGQQANAAMYALAAFVLVIILIVGAIIAMRTGASP